MKITIINKSDSTGGAAVVSHRLMEALREEGTDARMLVCEKLSDSPYIEKAASDSEIKWKFILERLKILAATGFNRKNLFKIDTGEEGLPLWKNRLVKDADAILINWVNQGMLSLKGFRRILKLGKPVIVTMHDMWWMTGICHHAGKCNHFHKECGKCHFLGKLSSSHDLSNRVWKKKEKNYKETQNQRLAFVAVSTWLKKKCLESSLLKDLRIKVIPNAFKIPHASVSIPKFTSPVRILFGAARLDDPIKGLETLKEASKILKAQFPEISCDIEIAMFGNVKDASALDDFEIPVIKLGVLRGDESVRKAYEESQIVVSASSYETLPGTMVEAQAYGCIPVSFNQGGQSDIIDNGLTGFIAEYNEDISKRSKNLAEGIVKAYSIVKDQESFRCFKIRMRENVETKFSYSKIAKEYISLINKI